MNSKKIAAGALVVAIPVAAAGFLAVGNANAATPAHPVHPETSAISAQASNPTPVSGHAFVVSGELTENGTAAGDHVVKVQALRDGSWQQLTGAQVRTTSSGDYGVRVILESKGTRDLRVVGVGEHSQPNAHQQFVVRVR